MIFKVAILQSRAENANIKRNIDTIISSMKEASKNGADMLLLPECFITGYELPMTYEKSISCEDEVIVKVCETAKTLNIGVVLTSFTKGKEQPQNTAFVINRSGEILMKYSKVHTCDFADEKDVEAGTEFKVCDFDMDSIREYRNSEMMGNTFRKVSAYKGLLDPTISAPFLREGQENI